jgi:putative heme-binding domain-containing protein
MKPGASKDWPEKFAWLTWRLMPHAAVPSLAERARAPGLSDDARKFAVDSLAFINTRESADALISLTAEGSPVRDQATWWLINRSGGEWSSMNLQPVLEEKGISAKPVKIAESVMPPKPAAMKFSVQDVLALKGDAAKGKQLAARCVMCHQIDGKGADYGPALKGFAKSQTPEVLARSIIDPSFDISHGFDGQSLALNDGTRIDGIIVSDGKTITIRSMAGLTQDIAKQQIKNRKSLDRSLMLSADQLGLGAQDVADLVEWMKSY